MTLRAGEHVDRRRQQLEVAEPAPLAKTSPTERITTRTGAVGDADLALDAERLGAGARVGDHQRGEHGDDDRGDRERRRRASAK